MPYIHELLRPESIYVGLEGESKASVLDRLIDLIGRNPRVEDLEAVREAVFAREAVMSTGVGKGLALPHAKTDAVRETVGAFAVTKHPIDFGAVDDEPVRLVFLLVGTEAARSRHIKLLSRVSRLLNRDAFRASLLSARTPETILAHFEEAELELREP